MRAITWHGKHDMRCEQVPDPKIEEGRDAIIRVTSCAICGSDLHFYNGFMPGMKAGDVVGHEFMGEVVEVGRDNRKLKRGDRVIVPFTIICGECEQCRRGNFSLCERTNPNAKAQAKGGARAVGLRTSWRPELTDAREAARHYWVAQRPALEAFLTDLARADVARGLRDIPGFVVHEEKAAA